MEEKVNNSKRNGKWPVRKVMMLGANDRENPVHLSIHVACFTRIDNCNCILFSREKRRSS